MARFEYDIHHVRPGEAQRFVADVLNQKGADGWELVGFTSVEANDEDQLWFCLKRQLP